MQLKGTGSLAAKSNEGEDTAAQTEYKDSFKRFKTLVIVGSACVCFGIIVVILGKTLQLNEVQRLGIIFTSFGIGWIVLAVAYIVYMKWCFVPESGETSTPQTTENNTDGVGPKTSRPLGRPPSSTNMYEILHPPEQRNLTQNSPQETSSGRSPSPFVDSAKHIATENEFESPLSSRNYEKRSLSVRNSKAHPHSEKSSKRLTSSLRDFDKPLYIGKRYEKHTPLVNNSKSKLPLEEYFQNLPSSDKIPDDEEGYLGRQSSVERKYKAPSLSSERWYYQRPSSESRYPERRSTSVRETERPLMETKCKVHSCSEGWNRKRPSSESTDFGKRLSVAKSIKRSSSESKRFERQLPLMQNIETQASLVQQTERQTITEHNYNVKHSSSVKDIERQSSPKNNLRTYSGSNIRGSLSQSPYDFANFSSTGRSSDAVPSYNTHAETANQDTYPPNYYDVVLSMPQTNIPL